MAHQANCSILFTFGGTCLVML